MVCLPASVLFFCVHEEPPDVLPVDEWLARENQKKQCCKPLRRYLHSKKQATWVWCQHTCCSGSVNLQEETEKSKEEVAFEEEHIRKLELKKSRRLKRVERMVDKATSKAMLTLYEMGEEQDHTTPSVYRASPIKSNRNIISAMHKMLLKKQGHQQQKPPVVPGDRFGMVRAALNEGCYTVDGKRFFRSKRRLDHHFEDNKLDDKPEVEKRKKRRKMLQNLTNTTIPLEQRNLRELYKERTRPVLSEEDIRMMEEKETEHKRQAQNKRKSSYNHEANNALKALNGNAKEEEEEEEEERKKQRRYKNELFQDLETQRIRHFARSLLIYDELFQPDMLWNYLDTYTSLGTDIRDRSDSEEEEERRPEEEKYSKFVHENVVQTIVKKHPKGIDGNEFHFNDGETWEEDEGNANHDWMCDNCQFANPLDLFVCQVCNVPRSDKEQDENGSSLAEKMAEAPWFTLDALKVPFRPLVELLSSCEDQRGARSQTYSVPWCDRDMFVDLSRTNSGQLAFAVGVFFNFGRIVSLTTDKRWSAQIDDIWSNGKKQLMLRKQTPDLGTGGGKERKTKNKNKKGKKNNKNKKKKKMKAPSLHCQVSSWLEFSKFDQMSVGIINLTAIPELNYPNYPLESSKWRPTLEAALGYMEERFIECELNTYLIVATQVKSGTVAIMGWQKIEEIGYVRNGCAVVLELFIRDDGDSEEDKEEVDEESLLKLSQANFG